MLLCISFKALKLAAVPHMHAGLADQYTERLPHLLDNRLIIYITVTPLKAAQQAASICQWPLLWQSKSAQQASAHQLTVQCIALLRL